MDDEVAEVVADQQEDPVVACDVGPSRPLADAGYSGRSPRVSTVSSASASEKPCAARFARVGASTVDCAVPGAGTWGPDLRTGVMSRHGAHRGHEA